MNEVMDTQRALQAVERLQAKLRERGGLPAEETLSLLKTLLQSPLFHHILALQMSSCQCNGQEVGLSTPSGSADLKSRGVGSQLHSGLCGNSDPSATRSVCLAEESAQASSTVKVEGEPQACHSEHVLHHMAQGRYVTDVELQRGSSGELGFSVVSQRSEDEGPLSFFVQDVTPGNSGHCNGSLQEGDQILAVNGQLMNQTFSPQEAMRLLLNTGDRLRLTVTRGPILQLASPLVRHMSPNLGVSVWGRAEMIELPNVGAGLGFGVVGGTGGGALVKAILPGGTADQDGCLQSGDLILRIRDTDLAGMHSEQVARLLHLCSSSVKLDITLGTMHDVARSSTVLLPHVAQQQGTWDAPNYGDEKTNMFDVELTKDAEGLGITLAGCVTERNTEPSGIFVKCITTGSKVEEDGFIHVGDQIIAVDGTNIQGHTSQQAVELLRQAGQTVALKLLRHNLQPDDVSFNPVPVTGPSAEGTEFDQTSVADVDLDVTIGGASQPRQSQSGSFSVGPAKSQTKLDEKDEDGMELTGLENGNKWRRSLENEVILTQVAVSRLSSGSNASFQAEVIKEHGSRRCSELGLLEVNGVSLFGETPEDGRSFPEAPSACVSMAPICPGRVELSDSNVSQCGLEQVAEDKVTDKLWGEFSGESTWTETDGHVERSLPEEMLSSLLAAWESDTEDIELEKGPQGLGFSILDYEDPQEPSRAVIVVRSLVPGGPAELSGRLHPGDRLVSVNDADLADVSLEEAVRTLKGVAPGAVRLGVARALATDSNEADLMNEKTLDPHYSDGEDAFQAVALAACGGTCSADLGRQMPVQTPAPKGEGPGVESASVEATDKHSFTSAGEFERTVTVFRGSCSLGMTVSAIKDGSGLVVRSVVRGGSIGRDGRVGVGDSVVAVNGERTWNMSSTEGRALLRKHSLAGPSISVTYVPAERLKAYQGILGQLKEKEPAAAVSTPAAGDNISEVPEQEEVKEDEDENSGQLAADYSSPTQPRIVELHREPGKSLGISITGGRGMGSRLGDGKIMRGIFIKHVLEDSPASRNGALRAGDAILEVGGVDLSDASHDQVVEFIRKAGDTVVFLVQSIPRRPARPPLPFMQLKPVPCPTRSTTDPLVTCHGPTRSECAAAGSTEEQAFKELNCRWGNAPAAQRRVEEGPIPNAPPLQLPLTLHSKETDTDVMENVPERPPLPLSSMCDADGMMGRQPGVLFPGLHAVQKDRCEASPGLSAVGGRGPRGFGPHKSSHQPKTHTALPGTAGP